MISPETFARYAAMRVPRYTSYPTAPNFYAGHRRGRISRLAARDSRR